MIVKKKLKKALIILGSIILVFILVLITAVLLFFYNKPLVRGLLEKQISKRTGIQVTIGKLDYELFPLRIEAESIAFSTNLTDSEVEVSVEKLVLRGDIHRIRKKQKPYLDSLEALGVRIRAKIKKARKKIVIEDFTRGLPLWMSYIQRINIDNSILDFVFSDKRINLQGVDFALSPSIETESFTYSFLFREAEGQIQPFNFGFHNTIQGSGILSLKETPFIDGRFIFTNNNLILDERNAQFEKIDLNFRGELQTVENILSFPTLEIEVPSYGSLSGPLTITLKDDFVLHFHPRIQIDDLSRILFLAQGHIPYGLRGVEIDGSAFFEGEGQFSPNREEEKVRLSGKVVINPTHIRYRNSGFMLDNVFAGSLSIHDFPENLNISGNFSISKGFYSQENLDLKGFTIEIPVELRKNASELNLPQLKGHFQALDYQVQKRKIEIMDVSLSGKGVFDLQKRKLDLSQANILIPPLPSLQMTALIGLDPEDSKSISVKCSNIDFQSLLNFLSSYVPTTMEDWEPDGVLNLEIDAHNSFQNEDEVWDVTTRVETSGVQFHDPSFSFAGESLEPNLILKGAFRKSFESIPFSVSFGLSHGESLWQDYYIDWNDMPIQGNIGGNFKVSERSITDVSMDAFIPNFGKFTGAGIIDTGQPSRVDLIIAGSDLDLSSWVTFMTQKRGGNQIPSDIRGKAEARIALRGNKNVYSIKGHLKIQDASLAIPNKKLSIKDINAHIPLIYEKNSEYSGYGDDPVEKGFLVLTDIHTSSLALPSLKLDLSAQRNRFTTEPLELQIFGGEVTVGRVFLEFGSQLANFKGQTSFFWKEADLSQLPVRSTQFQLKGRFSMNLPRIEIFPDQVSTEGQCVVEAYGGNITANNIQIERPFSQARTISCDVNFTALDLEKITDSIPFGQVKGIINGEIQDLAFSYGQPERFIFRVESKKRRGIDQRFSLKATNDIAIIGTGEKTPLSPSSGWTRFIKEFRYDKIGIYCSLKNDMFTLRGTIHRKGTEYLVKGSGLFAINVVNKQPRNQIRFKDMLSRLKRIGRSQQSQ